MNTDENKKGLWDLLLNSHGFKQELGVEKTRFIFEEVVQEVDALQMTILEKNKMFLNEFMKRIHAVDLTKQNGEMFESRMQNKTYQKPMKDLTEIKQLLYQVLERLDKL
jgi:hypothetical protein